MKYSKFKLSLPLQSLVLKAGQKTATGQTFVRRARTLWHGTSKSNAQSIQISGLMPQVGPWVRNSYGSDIDFDEGLNEDGDEVQDFDPEHFKVTFATDKRDMGKALGGIVSAVAHQLGKAFHDVTDADIVEHGALVKIESGDKYMLRRPNRNEPEAATWEREQAYSDDSDRAPLTVEPGDYYSRDIVDVDATITGSAMIRVLRQSGVWPRTWGPDKKRNRRELEMKKRRQGRKTAAGEQLERALDFLAGRDIGLRQEYETIVHQLLQEGYDVDELDTDLLKSTRDDQLGIGRFDRMVGGINGAEKVGETANYWVVRIHTYEASKALSSDNWCIGRDVDYWRSYTDTHGIIFYFYVSKKDGKAAYAVAQHPKGLQEVYNKEDKLEPAFGEDLTATYDTLTEQGRAQFERVEAVKRSLVGCSVEEATEILMREIRHLNFDPSVIVGALKNPKFPEIVKSLMTLKSHSPYLATLDAVKHQFPKEIGEAFDLDPKEITRWASQGASLDTIRDAKREGVKAKEFKVYADAGYKGSITNFAKIRNIISADQFPAWSWVYDSHKNNIYLDQIRQRSIFALAHRGFSGDLVYQWVIKNRGETDALQKLTPEMAQEWLTSDLPVAWVGSSLPLDDLKRLRKANGHLYSKKTLEDAVTYLDVDDLIAMARLEVSPHLMHLIVENRIPPGEALDWLDAKVSDFIKWRRNKISPAEAKTWSNLGILDYDTAHILENTLRQQGVTLVEFKSVIDDLVGSAPSGERSTLVRNISAGFPIAMLLPMPQEERKIAYHIYLTASKPISMQLARWLDTHILSSQLLSFMQKALPPSAYKDLMNRIASDFPEALQRPGEEQTQAGPKASDVDQEYGHEKNPYTASITVTAESMQRTAIPRWKTIDDPKVQEAVGDKSLASLVYKTLGRGDIFFSMTDIEKLGINPQSEYSTPLGIYAYPMADMGEDLLEGNLPFAGNAPYVNVFSVDMSRVIDAAVFSSSDLEDSLNVLRKMFPATTSTVTAPAIPKLAPTMVWQSIAYGEVRATAHKENPLFYVVEAEGQRKEFGREEISTILESSTTKEDFQARTEKQRGHLDHEDESDFWSEQDSNDSVHLEVLGLLGWAPVEGTDIQLTYHYEDLIHRAIRTTIHNTPFGQFWNITRNLAFEVKTKGSSPAATWNYILSKFFDGVVDRGAGLIHPNEPIQAVFFSRKAITDLGRFDNPSRERPQKDSLVYYDRLAYALKKLEEGDARRFCLSFARTPQGNPYPRGLRDSWSKLSPEARDSLVFWARKYNITEVLAKNLIEDAFSTASQDTAYEIRDWLRSRRLPKTLRRRLKNGGVVGHMIETSKTAISKLSAAVTVITSEGQESTTYIEKIQPGDQVRIKNSFYLKTDEGIVFLEANEPGLVHSVNVSGPTVTVTVKGTITANRGKSTTVKQCCVDLSVEDIILMLSSDDARS